MHPLARDYLASVAAEYKRYRALADRSIERLSDEQLVWAPDAESNSVAVLMKHVGGNLRSRFQDFLSSDGEKPDRDRDGEFEVQPGDLEAVRQMWEGGWGTLFAALEALSPGDLSVVVRIRGEAHTVAQALERSVAHTAYHVGQHRVHRQAPAFGPMAESEHPARPVPGLHSRHANAAGRGPSDLALLPQRSRVERPKVRWPRLGPARDFG